MSYKYIKEFGMKIDEVNPYKDWSIEKLYEQLEILSRRIEMYRGTLLPKDANIVEESVLEIMKIRSELNKRKSRR